VQEKDGAVSGRKNEEVPKTAVAKNIRISQDIPSKFFARQPWLSLDNQNGRIFLSPIVDE